MRALLYAVVLTVLLVAVLWIEAATEPTPRGWPDELALPRVTEVSPDGTWCRRAPLGDGRVFVHCSQPDGTVYTYVLRWGRRL